MEEAQWKKTNKKWNSAKESKDEQTKVSSLDWVVVPSNVSKDETCCRSHFESRSTENLLRE